MFSNVVLVNVCLAVLQRVRIGLQKYNEEMFGNILCMQFNLMFCFVRNVKFSVIIEEFQNKF